MLQPEMFKTISAVDIHVQAMQLTRENAQTFTEWCHGYLVETYDPVGEVADNVQVGVNFPGRNNVERVSEGQYLVKVSEFEFMACTPRAFALMFKPAE